MGLAGNFLRGQRPLLAQSGVWASRALSELLVAGCITFSPLLANAQDPWPGATVSGGAQPYEPPLTGAPQAQRVLMPGEASVSRGLPQQISAMPTVSEVLNVIQHRSQLIVARGNITRTAVADPTLVDVVQYSPNEIAVIGMELGTTTLTVWFDQNPQPLIYLVHSIRDPAIEERRRLDCNNLERKLAALFPNSRVALIPFSGKVVVKGQAHDVEEAGRILQIVRGEIEADTAAAADNSGMTTAPAETKDRSTATTDRTSSTVVNMLEVPGEHQVLLRVRIAELDRSQLRSRGVELTHLLFDGRHAVACRSGAQTNTLAGIFDRKEICGLVDALCANGTAKILSEPVLTVMSGHSASFLSGGEFAVPTIVGVDGVGAQQTTFHGFGTSLKVTPTVLDRDLIRMSITPEFSQLNAGNMVNGIPGVDTRRAQTTVQLREGQTIALAGLISHQTATETSHVKFLGDIPLVGPRLFAGKRSRQDETELLILVTPEIVRPMDADEVPPVPGHDVTLPNDRDFYHYGRTEGCPERAVYEVPPLGSNGCRAVAVGPTVGAALPLSPAMAVEPRSSLSASSSRVPLPVGSPAISSTPDWHPQQSTTIPTVELSALGTESSARQPQQLPPGAIRQTSLSSFEPQDAQLPSRPTRELGPQTWFQRPFRSFGWGQPPQRPGKSDDNSATAVKTDSDQNPVDPQPLRPSN